MSGGQRNEMLTAAYYSELGAGSISILTSTIQCFFFCWERWPAVPLLLILAPALFQISPNVFNE